MPISEHIAKGLSRGTFKSAVIDLTDEGLNSKDMDKLVELLNENPQISELNLYRNNISDDGVASLLKLKYIRQINLGYNNISDNVARSLARSSFQAIDLTKTDITQSGIEVFAKHSHQLQVLFSCDISDAVQEKLSKKVQANFENQSNDLRAGIAPR